MMEPLWQYSNVHNSACKAIERVGFPYEKTAPVSVADAKAILMESALLATPESKGVLGLLLNNPAFSHSNFL